MTSCAATTTIRGALWDEYREHEALSALASLEQLVEAAQALTAHDENAFSPEAFAALRAALAAVGPGEETADEVEALVRAHGGTISAVAEVRRMSDPPWWAVVLADEVVSLASRLAAVGPGQGEAG